MFSDSGALLVNANLTLDLSTLLSTTIADMGSITGCWHHTRRPLTVFKESRGHESNSLLSMNVPF